jgi:hypothetical protein
LQGASQQRVGLLAAFVRLKIIRGLEVDRIDLVGFNEFQDLHRLCGLRLNLLQFVRLNDDVLALAILIAFNNFVSFQHAVLSRTDQLLLHANIVFAMQLVKRNARTTCAREQTHRH